jgi:hypothetical protein
MLSVCGIPSHSELLEVHCCVDMRKLHGGDSSQDCVSAGVSISAVLVAGSSLIINEDLIHTEVVAACW